MSENDKPAGGWMKVSRPHKALPQVPPPKDQSATSTGQTESPPQSVSGARSSEATPVGSPTPANTGMPAASRWRTVKVQGDQPVARYSGMASSTDSSSGSETVAASNDDKRMMVIIIAVLLKIFGRNCIFEPIQKKSLNFKLI